MKAIGCLALLFVPHLLAGESADRVAIERTIAGLNEFPRHMELFAAGADTSALEHLNKLAPMPTFRTLGPFRTPGTAGAGRPTVTISREPWGEAAIQFPETASLPVVEILNPRIVPRPIRFITPDVALTGGAWTYQSNGGTLRRMLLFVMKKEGTIWRIAALHLLAATD